MPKDGGDVWLWVIDAPDCLDCSGEYNGTECRFWATGVC